MVYGNKNPPTEKYPFFFRVNEAFKSVVIQFKGHSYDIPLEGFSCLVPCEGVIGPIFVGFEGYAEDLLIESTCSEDDPGEWSAMLWNPSTQTEFMEREFHDRHTKAGHKFIRNCGVCDGDYKI